MFRVSIRIYPACVRLTTFDFFHLHVWTLVLFYISLLAGLAVGSNIRRFMGWVFAFLGSGSYGCTDGKDLTGLDENKTLEYTFGGRIAFSYISSGACGDSFACT